MHKSLIDKLFEEQIDEHANKLVSAVMCYKMSFLLCCDVENHFNETVALPLKQIIDIDEVQQIQIVRGKEEERFLTHF